MHCTNPNKAFKENKQTLFPIGIIIKSNYWGVGCCSIGRAVASNTRDPWFEPCHWQNFIHQLLNKKDKNNKKETRNDGPFKKVQLLKESQKSIGPLSVKGRLPLDMI